MIQVRLVFAEKIKARRWRTDPPGWRLGLGFLKLFGRARVALYVGIMVNTLLHLEQIFVDIFNIEFGKLQERLFFFRDVSHFVAGIVKRKVALLGSARVCSWSTGLHEELIDFSLFLLA